MSNDYAETLSEAAYRTAVIRLRQAAEWNAFDGAFKKAGGGANEIISVVDANVVALFLDPARSAERIYMFSGGGPSRDAPDPVLITFAAITAEFLFLSTPFTLGNDSGRLWRRPPNLAPAHGAEVASMLHRILGKGRQENQRLADVDTAARKVEEYGRALADLERMGRADQLHLIRSLPEALSGLFSASMLEASRWLRLQSNMITPLRELEWSKDPLVIAPPTDAIERWYQPILDKKRQKLTDPDDDLQDVEIRAYHDAEVLAQVIALNNKLLSLPGKPDRRAVFITADDAIHAVYQQDFWSKPNPSPERYVLRQPWQYIPILNAADIPNGYTLATLFARIKTTLDTVLATFFQPSKNGMFSAEYDGVSADASRLGDGVGRDRLLALWRDATDTATALCAGLAVQEYKLVQSQFSKIARNKPVLDALISLETKIFDEIEGVQLTLAVDQLLQIVTRARRELPQGSGLAKHRMPYLFEPEFDDLIGDQTLDEFLRQPVGAYMRDRLMQNFGKLSSKDRHSRAFYFAGVIAAAANRFESASNFLRAALGSLGENDPDRNAILYLNAVVTRLQLRTRDDFRLAQQELTILFDRNPSPLESVKLTSERASLQLTGYLASRLLQDSGSPVLDPDRQLLAAAKRDLLTARARLIDDRVRRQTSGTDKEMLRELKLQIYTNTLCGAVASTGFFEGHCDAIDYATVIENCKEIDTLLAYPAEDHIVWLWVQLSSCLVLHGFARHQRAEAFAAAAKPKLDAIETAAEGNRLLLDRRVFRYAIEVLPQLSR